MLRGIAAAQDPQIGTFMLRTFGGPAQFLPEDTKRTCRAAHFSHAPAPSRVYPPSLFHAMVIVEKQPADAPPAYSHSPASSSNITPRSPTGPAPAPPIAPCNQLTVQNTHNKVEGSFVVQSDLSAAEELLAPLSAEENEAGRRANLRLSSPHGGINADVWVLDTLEAKKPTWLLFHATHHGATIRIVRSFKVEPAG